jgi:hypothetical protein
MDGTFSTAPTGFNQVYIIHGKMGSTTIPLVYILLQNKTKQTYTEMLSVICEKCPKREVVQITIDFEKAVILAIEKVLPKVKIHCCYFHLCQSVWRKIQECGLVKKYNEDKQFQRDIAMITDLTFLPANYVKKGMYTYE